MLNLPALQFSCHVCLGLRLLTLCQVTRATRSELESRVRLPHWLLRGGPVEKLTPRPSDQQRYKPCHTSQRRQSGKTTELQ